MQDALSDLPPLSGRLTTLTQADIDAIRAYALQYGELVREACARECDKMERDARDRLRDQGKASVAYLCASAIRNKE